MSDETSLARRVLRDVYAIEIDDETGARVSGALLTMSERLVEPLASVPAPVEGFERSGDGKAG